MAVEASSELSESELDLLTGRFWINPTIPNPCLSVAKVKNEHNERKKMSGGTWRVCTPGFIGSGKKKMVLD